MDNNGSDKRKSPPKKLFEFTAQDLTWSNLKSNPEIRLYLGIITIVASLLVLVLDAQFNLTGSKNPAEKAGKFIGAGIMISLGIWLIVTRNKKRSKRYNDKVVDDLD